ncbi:Alpha/Beta hydrolase protein [Protomyces lactucae-debilis]|uniref:Alpha/Beta hydrolase protein n=1 Tax=Protomyces lactucae-debilis TaxID=2754530 RepID=A0A1Y2ES60_PROLT|nr:Alpha/Beta hydrolase protein [Protomyces lactucae-debilis]ORY73685.1 Alpha/Beta hydrolase protein [Protomyces lactucae-debilis]
MIALVKSLLVWAIWTGWHSTCYSIKLTILLLTKLPLLSYIAWATFSSLAVIAALSPDLVSQYRPLVRKAALFNCVALSAVSEVPHLIIVLKLFFIGFSRIYGTYRAVISWPFLLLDIISLAGCLGILYHQAEDVQTMVEQAAPFLERDSTRFDAFNLLVEVFAPLWREDELVCFKDAGYFGAEQLRENSVKRLVLEDTGTMDIYSTGFPPGSNKPIVINIHGGSWSRGSNKVPNAVLTTMARSGEVLVMSINFRLAPKFPLPAAIIDIKRAIIWAKKAAKNFGGDPNNIILMGDSSGGHCALLSALTANIEAFQEQTPDADTSVQGAVLLCPALDPTNKFNISHRSGEDSWFVRACCGGDEAAAKLVHPLEYASKDMPPLLSLHGTADTLVDIKNSRCWQARCAEIGAKDKFDLVEMPRAHHVYFIFRSIRTIAAGLIAVDWIQHRSKLTKDR